MIFFFQIDLFSVTVQFLMFYSFSCVMKKKFKAWFMSLRNTLSLASIFGLCFPNLFKVNIRRMPTFTHGEIYFALSHLRYARRDMYLESYIFRWKHYILRQLPSFTYLFPTEYIIFHWKNIGICICPLQVKYAFKIGWKKHLLSMIKVN